MTQDRVHRECVLAIDDDPIALEVIRAALFGSSANTVLAFENPKEALTYALTGNETIDTVVTDIEMPEMSGIEVIRGLRASPRFAVTPIVVVTSRRDRQTLSLALEAGATEFLTKPIDRIELRVRIQNLLALNRARRAVETKATALADLVERAVRDLASREREIIMRLSRAVENRDTDTGNHIKRVSAYSELIARGLNLASDLCADIALAATMHDIGKIAVPDAVLLKPGLLEPNERKIIERHAEDGFSILSGSDSRLIQLAAEIALSHHERFDGTGYPRGLSGGAIPLTGRIVAVADVFDALTTYRSYKPAWPLPDAFTFLEQNAGSQFDPVCVSAFLHAQEEVTQIAVSFADRV